MGSFARPRRENISWIMIPTKFSTRGKVVLKFTFLKYRLLHNLELLGRPSRRAVWIFFFYMWTKWIIVFVNGLYIVYTVYKNCSKFIVFKDGLFVNLKCCHHLQLAPTHDPLSYTGLSRIHNLLLEVHPQLLFLSSPLQRSLKHTDSSLRAWHS